MLSLHCADKALNRHMSNNNDENCHIWSGSSYYADKKIHSWINFDSSFYVYENRIHYTASAFAFFSAGGAMIQSKWPFSHHDLDSGLLIYHQTEFHLVVVLIHLWLLLCTIITWRHLQTSQNAPLIVFYFI